MARAPLMLGGDKQAPSIQLPRLLLLLPPPLRCVQHQLMAAALSRLRTRRHEALCGG